MTDEDYLHKVSDITHDLVEGEEYLLIFKPIYRRNPLKIIFDSYTDVNEEMYISYYTRPDETQPVVMPLSNIQEIKYKYLSNPVLKGGKKSRRSLRKSLRKSRRKSLRRNKNKKSLRRY
jgi:hypothetical protein